jgi:hypothetical protein
LRTITRQGAVGQRGEEDESECRRFVAES